jgi:hypothetical protein
MNCIIGLNAWGQAPDEKSGQYATIKIAWDDDAVSVTCHTFGGSVHWPMDFPLEGLPRITVEPNDEYLLWEVAVVTPEGVKVLTKTDVQP